MPWSITRRWPLGEMVTRHSRDRLDRLSYRRCDLASSAAARRHSLPPPPLPQSFSALRSSAGSEPRQAAPKLGRLCTALVSPDESQADTDLHPRMHSRFLSNERSVVLLAFHVPGRNYDLIGDVKDYATEHAGKDKTPESLNWFIGYLRGLRDPMGFGAGEDRIPGRRRSEPGDTAHLGLTRDHDSSGCIAQSTIAAEQHGTTG